MYKQKFKNKTAVTIMTCSMALTPSAALQANAGTAGNISYGVEQAQHKYLLKGKVTDNTGEPLPGASVMIKGTSTGAATDLEGNFAIPVVDSRKTVVTVSFIGMNSQDVTIAPNKAVTVVLTAEDSMLDELIVSGFQTISRERSSGSAIVVNSDKLNKIQASGLSAKLEGITPGFTVYNNQMSIRGTSSFSVDGTPLIVIDGQPATGMQSMDDINPEIIENVTVLKDAAATSLYGVRAANGVIVITTKRAQDNTMNLNFTADYYINPLPSLSYQHYAPTGDIMDLEQDFLLSDPDYIKDPLGYFNTLTSKSNAKYMSPVDMMYYRMAKGEITESELNAGLAAMRKNDYRREYRKQLQHAAITQDYNLSLSKGTDNNSFFASARYNGQGQYDKFNSNNNFSLYMKNDTQLTKWMKLTVGADFKLQKSEYTQASGLGYTAALPYERLYNDDGTPAYRYLYNQVLAEQVNDTEGMYFMGYNAAEEANNNIMKTESQYTKLFIQTNFDITKDLGLELKGQYEKRSIDGSEYDEENSYMMRLLINEFTTSNTKGDLTYNIPQGGRQYTYRTKGEYLNLRGQLNYKKVFADKHDVTALIGGEIRQDKYDTYYGEKFGYDNQRLTYAQVDWKTLSKDGVNGMLYPGLSTRSEILGMSAVTHRYLSAYFNAGYTYDSRYTVNASVRVDQADLFGTDPKYRYRPLWSVGASWNISNEAFMKEVDWVNMLKLRMTYGITGNVDQSSSPYLLARYATSLYTGRPITIIATPPNSSLRWEQTSTFNLGVDYRVIGCLSGSLDFYRRYSSDLLVNKSIDPSLGFNGQARANNGEMLNMGFEASIRADVLRKKDMSLSLGFSAAYNKNEIKKIDYEPTDALNMMRYPTSNYREGDAYNSLYAYRYAGLSETGNPQIYDENGEVVDTKAVRNVGAVVCAGQLTPKWNGALTADFRWKNLSVFAKMVYYTGHSLRRDVPTLYDATNRITNGAVNEAIADRWTPDNTDTDIPAMGLHGDTGERNYHWMYADANVCTASFIKLRNIGVSYSLPAQLLARTHFIKGLTLKLQVDNAFYWAANKYDIDPEAFNANSGSRSDAMMPSYVLGVNVKF